MSKIYNSTPNPKTNLSPNEIIFGQKYDFLDLNLSTKGHSSLENHKRMTKAIEETTNKYAEICKNTIKEFREIEIETANKNNNNLGFIDDEILPLSQNELTTDNNFFEKRDDDLNKVTFKDELIK